MLRGDGHFANPELMVLCEDDAKLDFLFGLAGNPALSRKAKPLLTQARTLHQAGRENARRCGGTLHAATWRYGASTIKLAPGPGRFLANHLRLRCLGADSRPAG